MMNLSGLADRRPWLGNAAVVHPWAFRAVYTCWLGFKAVNFLGLGGSEELAISWARLVSVQFHFTLFRSARKVV